MRPAEVPHDQGAGHRPTTQTAWAAASGYAVLVLGAAGAMLERGAPPFGAPGDEVRAFFARYRGELLTQSVVFVLAAGANLWFLAGLRGYLQRAEGRNGVLAALAFAAGVTGVAIGALIHAPQVALATRAGAGVAPEVAGIVADLGYGLSLIALVPIAVMLASVAAVSWRTGAFPAWVGWVSVRGPVAHVVGWFGVIVDSGRLAPGGWFTYVPYGLWMVWLFVVTTIMVARLGRPTPTPEVPSDREGCPRRPAVGPFAGGGPPRVNGDFAVMPDREWSGSEGAGRQTSTTWRMLTVRRA
ncbi:MAG TPA: hypothetical protein VK923_02120 [Euzebyales bacterium]|nr:hypothetical protein [Euzebyales bacterium]